MADKKYIVPETLAILPVRDTVLFPGAVLPLTVGRESSLALVNSLTGDEKFLGVVAQLDPRVEDPAGAGHHRRSRHRTRSSRTQRPGSLPRCSQPFAAAFRRPAERRNEHRRSFQAFGFHRRDTPESFHAAPSGVDRNRQRAQAPRNAHPRIVQGAGSPRTAQQNQRAGAGAGQPESARIFASRADEGHPEGTRRNRRRASGNRRATQKSRRRRNDPRSQERVRARTEAPGEN